MLNSKSIILWFNDVKCFYFRQTACPLYVPHTAWWSSQTLIPINLPRTNFNETSSHFHNRAFSKPHILMSCISFNPPVLNAGNILLCLGNYYGTPKPPSQPLVGKWLLAMLCKTAFLVPSSRPHAEPSPTMRCKCWNSAYRDWGWWWGSWNEQ